MDYTQYFETAKRKDTNEEYVFLKKCPENLRELIYSIHKNHFFDCGLNDWVYKTIFEAFNDLSEDRGYVDSIEADCYNNDLIKWLYDNGNAFAIQYCTDYTDEYANDTTDVIKIIGNGQYLAKTRIYQAVSDFLDERDMEAVEEEVQGPLFEVKI